MKITIICILLIIVNVSIDAQPTEPTTEPPEPPAFDDKAIDVLINIGYYWLLSSIYQFCFVCIIAVLCHEKAMWKLRTEHREEIRKLRGITKKSQEPFIPVTGTKQPANLMRSVEKIDKKDMTMKQIKFIEKKQKSVEEWDSSSKFKSRGCIQIKTLAVVANDLMENPADCEEHVIQKVSFDENSFVFLNVGLKVDEADVRDSKIGGSAGGIGSSSIMTASIRQVQHKGK